ncbi:MAG: SDR family NAD(P)-dependent oxidoreductase [Deltaproteobacteria bacterium]|nr:SDR family NAD(P)-dependent oxidoreductase [Deltaproteobacteria bacterium]MBW2397926.1 SDR family NAD(P)-dependent oxidoreductase [Deltaproteobacteria bacterium]
MAIDRNAFGFESTTDEVLDGISLEGRRAVITGTSGGLGAETARAMAARGAAITLAARDLEKLEAVAASIRESTGNPNVDIGELDLTVPDSVRRFATNWLESHDSLNLLINNAGIMACPLARTPEGWELQFATNHLGHFLLTALLAPALVAGAPARIVNLSSGGHRFGGIDFDDLHYERRDYDKWQAYGQSKSANVLFTVELDRRLQGNGVRSFAVHPGVIMTELARHLTPDDIKDLMNRAPSDKGMVFKPVEAGAATSCWAATAPELDGRGGLYLEDCGIAEPVTSDESDHGFMPHAVDPEAAKRLWAISEELQGVRFDT